MGSIGSWFGCATDEARLTLGWVDRFSEAHGFEKPNDERALKLMDYAACAVMREFPDITLAYGESDEYRCVYGSQFYVYGVMYWPFV
jgi:tRNAHis guanylyltransferase